MPPTRISTVFADSGIDRSKVYVTNAVKHFKWESRGKRRLHQKPNSRDIEACRPWLVAELSLLRPRVLVALGSTAARTLLGSGVRVLEDRGKISKVSFPCGRLSLCIRHHSCVCRTMPPAPRHTSFSCAICVSSNP